MTTGKKTIDGGLRDSAEWPATFEGVPLDRGHSALVLVDMQRYWTDPDGPTGGRLQTFYPPAYQYFYDRLAGVAIPQLARLLNAYRALNLPCIHIITGSIRDDGRDLPAHFRRRLDSGRKNSGDFHMLRVGGEWHQVEAALAPADNEPVLNKTTRSAFHSTGLDHLLKNLGVEHLVVGGLVTNGCVALTAMDAADRGYECFVVEDGCSTFSKEAHDAALINFHRVFGTVIRAADIIGE
jgi:nicotinamidase-related amidase